MEHSERMDQLARERDELVIKKRNATNEEEKKHYAKLIYEKQDEMIIEEFGDRNYRRFSQF